MEKMKVGNLQGIQRHNQRETTNHSNPDIDTTKSDLNYDLVNFEPINYHEKVKSIIDSQRISQRAVRKDAVLVDEWIITSDSDFFLFKLNTKEFFQDTVDYFAERVGSQNIAYATVHLDETTPHMHLGIVPMTEGKLSSKQVFDRQALKDIQDELPQYLQDKGHKIERGIKGSEQKHLTVEEYKENKKQVERMKDEVKDLQSDVNFYREKGREITTINHELERDLTQTKLKLEQTKVRLTSTEQQLININNFKQNSTWVDDNIMPHIQEKRGIGGVKYTISPESLQTITQSISKLHGASVLTTKKNQALVAENKKLETSSNKELYDLSRNVSELRDKNRELKREIHSLKIENNEMIEDFQNLFINSSQFMKHELGATPEKIDIFKGFLRSTKSFNFDWKITQVGEKAQKMGRKVFEKLSSFNVVPIAKKFIEVVQQTYRLF